MILFFDTETTGLPDFKARSDDPKQPHLVQLALLLMNDAGAETEAHNFIIKPDGWTIPDEVAAIHGITTKRAMDEGIPEVDAVVAYIAALGQSALRVAHNENFDRRIMRIAMLRTGQCSRDLIEELEKRPSFDTCAIASPIVNLPPTEKMLAYGFTKPKPPKLAECIKHFFTEELDGAHDAMVDVRACARIYFHLKSMEPAS